MNSQARKCAICGSLGTEKWTLAAGVDLIVADLCVTHSEPMHAVKEAVLAEQARVAGKPAVITTMPTVKPGKAPRTKPFEPLEWTPPSAKA